MECFKKIVNKVLNFASGRLKLLYRDSNRDTRECWYIPNWLYYSLQTKMFPLFWLKKWPTIQFDVFICLFIPMYQTISVINRIGAFAGVCACDCTHERDKTEVEVRSVLFEGSILRLRTLFLCFSYPFSQLSFK